MNMEQTYVKAYMSPKLKAKVKKFATKTGKTMYQVVQEAVKIHMA